MVRFANYVRKPPLAKKTTKAKRKRTRRRRTRAVERRAPAHKTKSIGEHIGGALGGLAQKGLGKLFGFGEYHEALATEIGAPADSILEGKTPDVNSLVAPLSSNDLVPIMHESREGSVVIQRREYIRTVGVSSLDTTFTIEINPGYANSFPWLHKVARNFQQFRFLGFAAEYVPLSGYAVSSDSAALGQVAWCFAYNVIAEGGVADWPITSYTGVLNMEGAVTGTPATPMSCYMECDPDKSNQHNRFVYLGATPLYNYSQQNLDSATLLCRKGGSQNAISDTMGQLWFTYEVVLHEPRPQDPALSLDLGDFREAWKEYHELKEFAGSVTDLQAIALEERMAEIKAVMDTISFKEVWARARSAAQRRRLRLTEHIPDISPSVQAIIDREIALEEKEGGLETSDTPDGFLVEKPTPAPRYPGAGFRPRA